MSKDLTTMAAPVLMICSLMVHPATSGAESRELAAGRERKAVERAVLDYCEAAYEMRPDLLERSVHPELHKFGFHRRSPDQPYVRVPMTYQELVELVKRWNQDGKFGKDALKKVEVYEVLDKTASAKLAGAWGLDFIHLAEYDGKWMIVQFLWQSHPKLQSAKRSDSGATPDMTYIEGGTFEMGDVFDEGIRLGGPVHRVTLSGYYVNKHEVTVEQFAAFVNDTGYVTSAENRDRPEGSPGSPSGADPPQQGSARLASCGAWVLGQATDGRWAAEANWKKPHFEQGDRHPVTCVSWRDAISYCNWLSRKEGLPGAYDVKTGDLLDARGRPTTDVAKVKGYRLPTEAEWEYAARERGKKIRFGNGQDIARASEINFDAKSGEFSYAEKGACRGKTTPVGSFNPNGLGLYDMSGNVWEWCSDFVGRYPSKPQTNPYQTEGVMGPRRAARGGPWVGDASWARVSARLGWTAEDRCNNIGFRVARTK